MRMPRQTAALSRLLNPPPIVRRFQPKIGIARPPLAAAAPDTSRWDALAHSMRAVERVVPALFVAVTPKTCRACVGAVTRLTDSRATGSAILSRACLHFYNQIKIAARVTIARK